MTWKMSVAKNVICWRRLTGLFPSDTPGCDRSGWRRRGSTDVADRQPMQVDQGRRDVLEATQAEHQSGSSILDAL